MEVSLLGKFKSPLPIILSLMVGGVLVVGLMTYKLVETPAPKSQVEKLTVPVQRETLAVEIKASGTVEPIQSVNISPKTPGRLTRLLIEQGMLVKQGQVLAVMDNDEIRAQGIQAEAKLKEAIAAFKAAQVRIPEEIKQAKARVVQAKAQVNQAQARLQQAATRTDKEIAQVEEQLKAADARYRLAEARVKRNQALVKEGAIAQDRFDEVVNDYISAKSNLLETLRRVEQAKTMQSPEIEQLKQEIEQLQATAAENQMALEQKEKTADTELAQLEAAAEAARADLERIKVLFRDTVITAPFDGIITQKYATEGAFVTPTTSASDTASATSTSILALAKGLEIVAKVPEVDVGTLRRGQPVNIMADAYPNTTFQGRVLRIAPEAIVEQNVTSFEVTIALMTGQKELRSKMNVDVTFVGQQLSNALVVPTVAIVTEKGQTGVMIPDKQEKPQFKPVTIGLVLDDKTQILSGLNPGERVFIDLPEEKGKEPDKEKE
jgi:HlyD family secretion protein